MNVLLLFLCITLQIVFISGVLWCGAFPGWIIFVTDFKINLFVLSDCRLLNFAYGFTRHYSSAILVIMCVEKFFALYFPLLAKRVCTVKTAMVVTLVTTCVYIAYDFQCFFVFKKDPESFGCQVVSQSYEAVFYRLDSILYSFGPFTIMIITNAAIIYKLMSLKIKETKGGSNPAGQAISKSATKGTAMLIIDSVMFVVLTGPMAIASILDNLNVPWVQVPSYNMQYMNHCINGVLYCIVGSKFRRELFKILPCCKRSRVENQPLTETANSVTAAASPI